MCDCIHDHRSGSILLSVINMRSSRGVGFGLVDNIVWKLFCLQQRLPNSRARVLVLGEIKRFFIRFCKSTIDYLYIFCYCSLSLVACASKY